MHQLAQHFELFLVKHAEALFFVDHDKAEILEGYVTLEKTMCADDDIHAAGSEFFYHLLLRPPRAETREQFDAHGIIGNALAKSIVVRLGENGLGNRHSNRLA